MNPAEGMAPASGAGNEPRQEHASALLHTLLEQSDALVEPEQQKELTEALVGYMEESGGTFFKDVGDMYPLLQGEHLFVRREDPRLVVKTMYEEAPISIHTTSAQPYPNAVEWNYDYGARGLENAFLEGRAHLNGIVTVIGFHGSQVTQKELIAEAGGFVQPGGSIIDRSHVVSIDGDVPKDDIRFLIARIPLKLVPEHLLTEEELELADKPGNQSPKHIFRGVLYGAPKETPAYH